MKNNTNNKIQNPLVGQIGWCSAKTLDLKIGHFVFIREVKNNKCSVNTLTSLKNKKT